MSTSSLALYPLFLPMSVTHSTYPRLLPGRYTVSVQPFVWRELQNTPEVTRPLKCDSKKGKEGHPFVMLVRGGGWEVTPEGAHWGRGQGVSLLRVALRIKIINYYWAELLALNSCTFSGLSPEMASGHRVVKQNSYLVRFACK